MKYYTFILTLVLTILFNTGCVSGINNTRLDLGIDNIQKSELLKLTNSNDDINLSRLSSQIMEESGFLNQNGQEYGYYAIGLNHHHDNAPNSVFLGFINAITLFVPSLIGFPTDLQEFDITAYFYIFDSTGTMIKIYKYSNSFNKIAGLYYGQDPTQKASHYYSILFKGILDQINKQQDEINYLLKEAGPITTENRQAARIKITAFFDLDKSNKR
ncbi:MAG: hypothetical protein LBU85_06630 [Treponema sp.]|jgi:hypothetical protein|nr:hypothetical protein [Treponema sp.]